MPRPDDNKPDFPPSYELHVRAGIFGEPDFQSFQRFDLKDLIGELYEVKSVRVLKLSSLDDGKALTLPARTQGDNLQSLPNGVGESRAVPEH